MITKPHFLTAAAAALHLLAGTASAHPGHDEFRGPAAAILAEISREPASGVVTAPANEVSIAVEGDFRVIKSNGWPDHAPGAFPRRGNPNTATPQHYSFRVPVKPRAEPEPVRGGGFWWGVALNGVPFEPGTAEAWNNDRQSGWRYEAATGFLNLGLDEHNAHVQPTGAYHYHALPAGLIEKRGGDEKQMLLIGWAADGFPLYSSRAYSDAKDARSALRKMKSSWQLRKGARPAQAGGPGGNYDGRFTQDFEFVKDSGDLDECNGRTGVTPEFPGGTYYYCLTVEFPFVPRSWRGVPDPSFAKGGPPPGGPPPGFPPPPLMRALDTNSDGILDPDEIAKAPEALKSLDKNADGALTPEEYHPPFPGGGGR